MTKIRQTEYNINELLFIKKRDLYGNKTNDRKNKKYISKAFI